MKSSGTGGTPVGVRRMVARKGATAYSAGNIASKARAMLIAGIWTACWPQVSAAAQEALARWQPAVIDSKLDTCKPADLGSPRAIAIDREGNLYITSETGPNAVYRLASSGTLTPFFTRVAPYRDYQGLSIAIDRNGLVLLASETRKTIERIDLNGRASVVAGRSHQSGIADGPARVARFKSIQAIASADDGNLYVIDSRRVRKVTTQGQVSSIAGSGRKVRAPADGRGTHAAFVQPNGLAVAEDGSVYVTDGGPFEHEHKTDLFGMIRRIDPTGNVQTVAGHPGMSTIYVEQDGDGTDAQVHYPFAITRGSDRSLYFTETLYWQVRSLDERDRVSTLATGGSDENPRHDAELLDPTGIAVDSARQIFIVDAEERKLYRLGVDGTIQTLCVDPITRPINKERRT